MFDFEDRELHLDDGIVTDAELRAELDAFEDADSGGEWALLVQTTRSIRRNDFKVLTHRVQD